MTEIEWDKIGRRYYEAGVSKGVLYPRSGKGVPWNGLVSVTERPDTGEVTEYFLNGIKYLETHQLDVFKCTIEAYTYPYEFEPSMGIYSEGEPGFYFDGQYRQPFSFSYQTGVGSDTMSHGRHFKIHLVYSATATPTDISHTTLDDSPEGEVFSWEVSTVPRPISGHRRGSHIVIDSRRVSKENLKVISEKLYGTEYSEPSIPSPATLVTVSRWGGRYKLNTQTGTGLNYITPLDDRSDLGVTPVEGLYSARTDGVMSTTTTPGLYSLR